MDNQLEIINKALELIKTMEEAILYIEEQLKQNKLKETIYLLEDMMYGVLTIQNSIEPLLKELNAMPNSVEEQTNVLKLSIMEVVEICASGKAEVINIFEKKLKNSYFEWQEEVGRFLNSNSTYKVVNNYYKNRKI